MAKRRIQIEVETDLHDAIQQEAAKRGISKGEVIRSLAQKFLSKVNDTSGIKRNSTNKIKKS